jgi:hypothetical protein
LTIEPWKQSWQPMDALESIGSHALALPSLIDEKILDVVFVLILVTATIGPILTQHYTPLRRAPA